MPLSKLQFKPGFVKDATDYANEGGWFSGNKVRFRMGFPEKIGGWERLSNASFLTPARRLFQWRDLSSTSNIGVATDDKYYVFRNSLFYDVTPIRSEVAAGSVTFSAQNGSSTITVSDTGHSAEPGGFVVFSGAESLGGNITADVLNQEYQVLSVLDNDTYTIQARSPATSISEITTGGNLNPVLIHATGDDTGSGGSLVAAAYLLKPQLSKDFGERFSLSSASYTGDFFDVGDQVPAATDISLSTSGDKLFVLSSTESEIFEYDLSSDFNIRTAAYNGVSFDISGQTTDATSLAFDTSGLKMYVSSWNSLSGENAVYQYSLLAPFDISGASYSGKSFTPQPRTDGLVLSLDGFFMYAADRNTDKVFQYNLSVAFDISTAVYSGSALELPLGTAPSALSLTKNGKKLYVLRGIASAVVEYDLETPYDLGTAVSSGSVLGNLAENPDGGPTAMFAAEGGAFLFVAKLGFSGGNPFVSRYNLLSSGAIWSQDNFGEDLLINQRGGPIYYWDASDGTSSRAISLADLPGASDPPSQVNQVMVSDRDRHVIAFGAVPQGGTDLDPMLIRFSDQENPAEWTATAANTAGDLVLGSGSQIVVAVETRQQTLVLTDTAAYAMQYLGPPFTFGATRLSDNISIISPTAATSVDDLVVWMGAEEFFIYDGTIKPLPCPVKDFVFETLNTDEPFKVTAGTNTAFGEIWWFYPGAPATGVSVEEYDRYVIYNYQQNIWYTGTLGRDAWLDRASGNKPVAAGGDGYLYVHETGVDDGSTIPSSPINAFIQSSPIDVEDGDRWTVINQIVPDVDFRNSTFNSNPTVKMTLEAYDYPGQGPQTDDTGSVTRTGLLFPPEPGIGVVDIYTDKLDVRLNGRAFSLRIESTDLGVAWRSGMPRVDILPNKGRR